jgi:hypothetical protein
MPAPHRRSMHRFLFRPKVCDSSGTTIAHWNPKQSGLRDIDIAFYQQITVMW